MEKPVRNILLLSGSREAGDRYSNWLNWDQTVDYQCIPESDSVDVQSLCGTQRVDGILIDQGVASVDGQALLQRFQAAWGVGCPPIVVIGHKDFETAVAALKAGATDYLAEAQLTAESLCRALNTAIQNATVERKLQSSQEQFQASVENMLDCFGIFSAMRDGAGDIVDFRIDYLNESACLNNQMTREQQIGRGLCEIFPAHRESGLFDEYCQLVETGRPLIKDSLVYDDLYNGQRLIRAFDIRASKFHDGFVASWRDITHRKQLELQLEETAKQAFQEQARLQHLINNAPIGIGIGAADGQVRLINDAMLALHGYTRKDFEREGMNWRNFSPPEYDEQTDAAMTKLRQQGASAPEEKEIFRPDGTRVPVWISATSWLGSPDEHVAFAVDLSAQKQVEADLITSQQHYQALAEAMPQIVWTADTTGAVNYWNQRWYEYTGLTATASMGMGGLTAIHPDDRDRTLTRWQQALASGEQFEVEYRLRRQDGRYRRFITRSVPNRDRQGEIAGWIGTITDIEDQKQIEDRFRLVTQAVNGLVFDWDRTTNAIYRSDKLFDLLGYRPEEVPPTPEWWCEQIHPEDLARMLPKLKATCASNDTFYEAEYRVQHREGRWVHLWERSYLVRDEHNQVVRMVGSTVDVSRVKQTEFQLKEAHIQLESALAAGAVYTWRWHIAENRVIANRSFAHLFGIDPTEAAQGLPVEHYLRAIHPDDQAKATAAIQRAIATGDDLTEEYRIRDADGLEHWVIARGRVEYDENGTPMALPGALADITDRKRIEAALKQKAEEAEAGRRTLEALMEYIPEGITIADAPDVSIRQVSRYGQQLLGKPLAALANIPAERHPEVWRVYHADGVTLAAFEELPLTRAVQQGAVVTNEEWVLLNADGQPLVILCNAGPIRNTDGDIIGGIIAWRDITDRKRQALERQRHEAILQSFLAASPVALALFDQNLRYLYANEALATINGLPIADHLGRQLGEVLPDIAPQFEPLLQEVIDTQEPVLNLEFSGEVRPGITRSTLANHYPVCLPNGDVIGVGVAVTDVTDMRRAEAALRRSEDSLRLALEAAQMGTWDWNFELDQLNFDAGCRAILGLPPAGESNLEDFFEALHAQERDRIRRLVDQVLNPQHGGRYDAEYRVVGSDRTLSRWVKATGQVYFKDDGQPSRFVGVVLDITAQKQIEAQRTQLLQREQAAREAAEQANRVKDEFLAILSHELRSPLNPILGWARLLRTKPMGAERTQRALETIERNAQLQTQLVDDLLDIAKILRGKLKLETTFVDPIFVIEAAIETVQSAAQNKNIKVQTDLEIVGQIEGDAGRLQQVVWNLLTNAVKFTPSGGQIEIQLTSVDGWAQIEVSDTGIGINPDFLPHIFESFRQEDTSVTRQFGGLGLGLAIVRYLVEAHGGQVAASNREGQGATFQVRLPLPHRPYAQTLSARPWQNDDVDLSGLRVMVIEDNPDSLELMAAALDQYGATVASFASAIAALKHLATYAPDVIVSDIGMPDIDGYDLMRQIRSRPPEQGGQTPAIALTAYVRAQDCQKAIECGYQMHVAKPLEVDRLASAIAQLARK